MPAPDTSVTGAPIWTDLLTSDPERARAFYCDLFGWEVVDPGPDYGGYVNFTRGGALVGGCMGSAGHDAPGDLWTVYFQTADARATTATAEAAGAQVPVPPTDILDLGVMVVLGVADDAATGLWQPRAHAGFGVIDEVGAPGWFELHTRRYDDAVGFCRDVLGWDAHVAADEPGFRYTTLGEGEAQRAGIMDASQFMAAGEPGRWYVYFRVADADATLAAVKDLGGTVLVPAEDTPYGRLATAADPSGAVFKLMER